MGKVTLFVISVLSSFAYAFELDGGIGLNEVNEEEFYYTSIPYAVARQGHSVFDEYEIKGFYNAGSYVFSISDNLTLVKTETETRNVVSSWDVESFRDHFFINAEYVAADDEFPEREEDGSRRRFNPDGIAENRTVAFSFSKESSSDVGCFQKTPLRIGDIENDGQSEIVLFVGYNFVVFSPKYGRVVFSAHFWQADELSEEEKQRWFGDVSALNAPQYVASSGTNVLINDVFPAWRSLTKLYSGEFDGEEGHDLLLWRKVYDSNDNSEPQGFHKVADRLVHYSRRDGSYQLLSTSSDMIMQWLSENNMTWKSGFPSVGECENNSDNLIQKMHDPLLNDADVLQ